MLLSNQFVTSQKLSKQAKDKAGKLSNYRQTYNKDLNSHNQASILLVDKTQVWIREIRLFCHK